MTKLLRKWQNSDGFTLIELLAVVAILAIIAGIGIPRVMGAIRRAENAAVAANEQLIHSAIERYLMEEERLSQSAFDTAVTTIENASDTWVEWGAGTDTGEENAPEGLKPYISKWPNGKKFDVTITYTQDSDSHVTSITQITVAQTN